MQEPLPYKKIISMCNLVSGDLIFDDGLGGEKSKLRNTSGPRSKELSLLFLALP